MISVKLLVKMFDEVFDEALVSFHRDLSSPPGAGTTKATKTEALRRAALKVMKNPETSHPFYWAGFVLVGDGS